MPSRTGGFTLIELSIVLVIIGLIVGGILVGRDLITAATTRSQIAQIERLYSAANAFRGKYNSLPGDMRPEVAKQFNFTFPADCDGTFGKGDGDWLLFGTMGASFSQLLGEPALFWQEITDPVAGNITEFPFLHGTGTSITCTTSPSTVTGTSIYSYIPAAKISNTALSVYTLNGTNYIALETVDHLSANSGTGALPLGGGITSAMAFNIDTKIDDGSPVNGRVLGAAPNYWWGSSSNVYLNTSFSDTTTSCYNTSGKTYSISSAANYGAGANCALSFKF